MERLGSLGTCAGNTQHPRNHRATNTWASIPSRALYTARTQFHFDDRRRSCNREMEFMNPFTTLYAASLESLRREAHESRWQREGLCDLDHAIQYTTERPYI